MLPSFLTFYLGAHEQDGASRSLLARVREGLTVGAVLSLAFGAVFVVVGLLVSAGLRTVIEVVPWLERSRSPSACSLSARRCSRAAMSA